MSILAGIIAASRPFVSDPLDADNYTLREGADAGTTTLQTDGSGYLQIAMTNDTGGSGKILIQPTGGGIDGNAGVFNGSTGFGFAIKIQDHTGWDGTAAWLGLGLGSTDLTDLASIQLQSRNSTTQEFAHNLERADGFTTTLSSGWASGNVAWGEDAISPKTVPIYLACRYTTGSGYQIYRGVPGSSSWVLLASYTPSVDLPATNDLYGILMFSLTGTQSFDVRLSQIYWDWNGSDWPFV